MYFRFLDIKTLPSTRSYHQFIPIHETLVGAKRISEQVEFTSLFEFSGGKSNSSGTIHSESAYLIGDYVACTYDHDWYIRIVESVCEDEGDLSIRFMDPKRIWLEIPQKYLLACKKRCLF